MCYEDSVQIDEVRRVCKECYAKGLVGSYFSGSKINMTYVGGALKLARRIIELS
ncbi:hypothetical protein ASAC_1087 [Acidilobus saccharovorans 345-15]|uniref:Uncharacterized protein n=1 Tax=Acidilobus saccharovorans (strain DSM 16705 / JCM 18335 / VKM B-2471 / 345-15) TaxID=666510 RepID=D9Q2F4_ACIS3|nr:hypothetical protein ASAC_1087 [Acidilobus saccharovorans 345-15]